MEEIQQENASLKGTSRGLATLEVNLQNSRQIMKHGSR
jgi:hypothetical protein